MNSERILITGGAGYIGSITAKVLIDSGFYVVIADSLDRGNRSAIDKLLVDGNGMVQFKKGNLLDRDFVKDVFSKPFDGVIHFAGFISIKESVENPNLYLENNVAPIFNIKKYMNLSGSDNLVFSSSAGVYGNPSEVPISENSECRPLNPYGESKLMVERILASSFDVRSVSLRYFNASGAMFDSSLGEAHKDETHIIPLAMKAALEGREFYLYGADYSTPDGTCVRDYVHVLDLAQAHILAIKALMAGKNLLPAYNVGTGKGYSNRQVIEAVEKKTGKKINIKITDRRPGDAASLVADNVRIKSDLGFDPKYSDLETIVRTAYDWHMRSDRIV